MGKSLFILVNRPPYGSIWPSEALRHARGALAKGWDAVLALAGDGVSMALPGQSPPPGEWVSLSGAMAQFMEEGTGRGVVLAEIGALAMRGISAHDLIPGIQPVALRELAGALAHADRVLIF